MLSRLLARASVAYGLPLLIEPSRWTEEMASFQLGWLALLGAAYALRKHEHLGFDFIYLKMTARRQEWTELFARGVVILFSLVVLVYGGSRLVLMTFQLKQTTAGLQWPMAVIYAVIPVSGLLMALFAAEGVFAPGESQLEEGRGRGGRAMTVAVLTGVFILLLFLRVPVAFCIGASAFAAMLVSLPLGPSAITIAQRVGTSITSFTLLAIPFFVLAGRLLAYQSRTREALEIYDRVGGGDSFASGLIYGFLEGRGPQWAVECGAAHGALAMTTPGDTTMATLPEVERVMKGSGARVAR